MRDQGSGGTSFFRCHICKQKVKMLSRLDAVHDDGTPICLEKTETSEHVAECMEPQSEFPCKQCWEIECECTCICERLRACEERVIAAAEAAVENQPVSLVDGRAMPDDPPLYHHLISLEGTRYALRELRERP